MADEYLSGNVREKLATAKRSATLYPEDYTVNVDLCQYFEHKKLKGYADFFNSSSSFCCGVI